MKRVCSSGLLAALLLSFAPEIGFAAGDAANGSALHEACLGCHGTELYVPPKAKVKSLSALKKAVDDWNDRLNPKFSKQEVQHLVAYLNRNFYHFPE